MLDLLASLCSLEPDSAALVGGGGALLSALFLAGLAGGTVHCAAMCGPFVLAQASDRLAQIPASRLCERHRLAAVALWPYHLGRIATYSALGGLAGGIGGAIARSSWFGRGASLALLVVAVYFLLQAWRGFAPLKMRPNHAPAAVGRSFAACLDRLRRLPVGTGLATGLLLGFLPCGLIYSALAAAAASGSAATGAGMLASFALGTVPSLVLVGWIGAGLAHRWQAKLAGARPYLLLVAAALVGSLAIRMAIGAA